MLRASILRVGRRIQNDLAVHAAHAADATADAAADAAVEPLLLAAKAFAIAAVLLLMFSREIAALRETRAMLSSDDTIS